MSLRIKISAAHIVHHCLKSNDLRILVFCLSTATRKQYVKAIEEVLAGFEELQGKVTIRMQAQQMCLWGNTIHFKVSGQSKDRFRGFSREAKYVNIWEDELSSMDYPEFQGRWEKL